MKKKTCAMSLVPSLLMASGMVFASNGSVTQLSDVSDAVKEIAQEQRDLPIQPGQPHPGFIPGQQPGQFPGHPVPPGQPHPQPQPFPHPQPQPPQPPQPHPQPPQPQPPQPPQVDTTQAHNAGLRDGAMVGEREGRQRGYADGIDEGEREGRRRGYVEGERNGRESGYRDGYNVDQSAGTQRGNIDGQNNGTNEGTAAGQKRCYDEGYTSGYNSAFAAAQQAGLQDAASYNNGFAKGQSDAAGIEAENGRKAGYQAGFSQRETELQSATFDAKGFSLTRMGGASTRGLDIDLARGGWATPQEQQAYQQGYREGYDRSYRRAYEEAKRHGFDERFQLAYRRAYDAQFSVSYRDGFTQGKEKGYQDAYNAAYNDAYNSYFYEYKNREYSANRAQGMSAGQASGQKEGFEAGCAEQTKRGYKDGYAKKAAEVYPVAFEAGKQAGVAAADKYYGENSVLKVFNASLYDENRNGRFEAGENVALTVELRNFGFQKSDSVLMTVKSERGDISLYPDLKAEGVGGRARLVANLWLGKLFDVVAPDSDALQVTFTEKGKTVGDARLVYQRTNANKVAVMAKDEVDVTKKDTWFFPGKVATLKRGDKVLVVEQKGDYYKVRKSAFMGGGWNEGFVKSDKVTLQ